MSIGDSRSVPFAGTGDFELELFQQVVADLDALEAQGLIVILSKSRERRSGRSLVDLVAFKRVK